MYESDSKTELKRTPRQERSQNRFEKVVATALRLFAARGYEDVSMREIAREARIPIATVYQYFPTKLAIVREMWGRYTRTIRESLADDIRNSRAEGRYELEDLIGRTIDRIASMQTANPAFIEVWSCVAASMGLRALNVEEILQLARMIADTLMKMHPKADAAAVYDRALVAIQATSATTRLALTLPEPQRARLLHSLKETIHLLLAPGTFGEPSAQLLAKARPADSTAKTRSRSKKATS